MNTLNSQRTCPTVTRRDPLPFTAKRWQLATEEETRIYFHVKKSQEHIDYEPQSFPIMKLLEQAEEKRLFHMNLVCGNEMNQLHAAAISRGKKSWLTIKTLVPVVSL
jgi:hypothetical protein